jgi:hypothetical protein
MSGNPTRIAPPKFDQRNEQHTRSSVETRLRANESFLDNEVRLFKADFTLANGANSDLELPSVARFLRITGPSGAFSVSGFQGGYEAKRLILFNPTAQTMTVTNDATSVAANRILTLTGADVVLAGPGMAQFIYSVSDARWLLEDFTSATLNGTTVELGGTTDTTLSRLSAGVVGVEGIALLRANQNLADVSSAATAFTNIKQAASDTATGAIEIAIQSEMEAGSDALRAVTPARQQFHPSAAKAWVNFNGTSGVTAIRASYNVSSVTYNAAGDYTVNFTTAFSSANYGFTGTAVINLTNGGIVVAPFTSAPTASAFRFITTNLSFITTEALYVSIAFFGDQ